ncbi:hypothetical protein PR048_018504 [Dryococelus australis]|uniref:Uncharacterized protein n=1 Tax=Dryococelus australis TaxID=614101 RepID=A0ABQ9HCG5_9NEOP|nr:hypothetical protein PR048_018504 [Dryococelus australis]
MKAGACLSFIMPRPRSCAADIDTVLQTIRRFKEQIVNEDGSIAKKNSGVWTNISESLNYDISSNYAYTITRKVDIFVQNQTKMGIFLSENSTRVDMNDQQFVVTLSPEEWSRMKPEELMYKCVDKDKPNRRNRAYHIIPPNSDWTDTLNEHFWDHTSFSCALSFKRAKVYKSGTPFLTIFGRCKSCSSSISGFLHQKPNENRHVHINFKYRGPFVDCSAGSKRILKGRRRRSALKEHVEKNVSACTVRREETRRSMHLGDNEPSHMPTLNALRLAKSRELKSRYVDDDPILAVGKLKYSAEYYSTIREIGLDPFHNHSFPTVASDATGGIIAKLKRPFGNVSGVVYLYSVAVHHMLSESHNNLRIHHFLESWLRRGAPVPKEADNCPKENSFPEGVENEDETPTDFMTWAHQIISEVKGNLAEEEGDHDNLHFLPEIVVCIAKLMKFLPLWSAIIVPKFGYGSLTSSRGSVESIFKDIKHRNFQNVHLPTTMNRNPLKITKWGNEIGCSKNNQGKKVLMQRETDASQVIKNAVSLDISQNTTREDGIEVIGNDKLNNSKYKTGIISAHTPKCFACFRGDFPTGAHICSVCGTPVRAAFSECSILYGRSEEGYGEKCLCVKCADKVRTAGNSSSAKDIQEDSAKENWRGLTSLPPKKRQRHSYLEPSSEFEETGMPTPLSAVTVGLFKNGNRVSSLQAISLCGQKFILTNTCSFVSLDHILAASYTDSVHYKDFVQNNNNITIFKVVEGLARNNTTSGTYRQRAEVLRPICESSILSTNLTQVISTSAAKAMANRLLAYFPSVTETSKCTNIKCVTKNSILRPVISIAIEIQSLNNLEAYINQFLAEEKMQCSENCDGLKAIVSTSSNQHLLIEVVNSSIVSNPSDIAYPFEVPLKEVPRKITLKKSRDTYFLRGVVATTSSSHSGRYKKTLGINVVGHYVACCLRPALKWEIYNDLCNSSSMAKQNITVNCEFLLYTIKFIRFLGVFFPKQAT